ncbi:SDR family oxidoreductase [Oceanibacterium hippocampi]|uniref:4-formylbenzenesulfonate dehydrogenase TsaC1/TsaC2 n=1 Tax=Oceanibacterium hippocampi TaxID=745714 RepID=A0A1Y5SPM1_9PROT|nr:SDR family oxidoreductase [Oceanibacterium hippocampi]SLN42459.1 4-formylbenzenesulfonate dehydrogenase TsaC1/TsaC2 [Oceanibacterium hippocampi]
MARLAEKRAFVTGAGSGIGAAIAARFAEEGASVAAVDRDFEKATAVAEAINRSGGKAIAVHADVTSSGDVGKAFEDTVAAFGGLEIIVNCAGITQRPTPCTEMDEATIDRIFSVNLKSVHHTTVHGVPILRRHAGSAIVNIASVGGVRPRAAMGWYGASKAAMIALSASMALELAPERIRVNAVAPVRTDTPMVWFMAGGETEERRARMNSEIPLGRIGHADDIARAALYLASDEAAFVTGQCLSVDGGRTLL